MIIRHGEKPGIPGEPVTGVDENATLGDGSLTPRGWQRAGALVPFFCNPWIREIRPPAYIYAARPGAEETPGVGESGKRPFQTVQPLARKLIHNDPDTKYGKDEYASLAAEVLTLDGDVLISWEHKRIRLIVEKLQSDNREAPAWPDRFDLVWCLTHEADHYVLSAVAQLLLQGDEGVDANLAAEIATYNSSLRPAAGIRGASPAP